MVWQKLLGNFLIFHICSFGRVFPGQKCIVEWLLMINKVGRFCGLQIPSPSIRPFIDNSSGDIRILGTGAIAQCMGSCNILPCIAMWYCDGIKMFSSDAVQHISSSQCSLTSALKSNSGHWMRRYTKKNQEKLLEKFWVVQYLHIGLDIRTLSSLILQGSLELIKYGARTFCSIKWISAEICAINVLQKFTWY